MSENLGAKFSIDITQLKAGLAAANRAIRESESEFKAAAAGMGDWTKSQEGLEKRIATLNKTAEIQSAKVTALKQEYNRLIAEGLDPTSAKATDLRTKINNETAALEKSKAEIAKQTTALQQMQAESADAAKKAESLTEKVKRQETELAALKQKYTEVAASQGKNSDEAKKLAQEITELSGDLKENKKQLKDAADAADDFDQSLEETSSGGISAFGVALGNLIANVITSAISKMRELVTETINVGKQFDSSMSQVAAVSGATGDELEALRSKAKEMGASTKFTASEAADAFNYMAMAGWKTEQMIDGIPGVLNLAAASGADLATTSDIVTDALTAMGYGAQDAGRLADVMAAASSNANTNVEMMGQTFKYAAPVVGALGYSMEDTAVAVGLMANAGIKADQAGTALRSILNRMAAPTKESQGAMDALGVSLTDSSGKMKSLDEIMQDLRKGFANMSETEQTATAKHLAGAEAMSGLLAIVNAAPEDFDKLTKAVKESEGAAEKMASTMQDNLGGDMTKLGSKFEGLQLTLYEKFEPTLRKAVEALDKLLDAFNWIIKNGAEISGIITGVGVAVGTFLAIINRQAILTAFIGLLGKIKAGFLAVNAVMLANPVGLVIAAIAGLVAAFVVLWKKSEKFRNFWKNLWSGIKKVAEPIIKGLADWFSAAWDKIKAVWSVVVEYFKTIFENIKLVFSAVKSVLSGDFSGAWDAIKQIFANVKQFFEENVWGAIKGVFEKIDEFFGGIFSAAWDKIVEIWQNVASWFDENVVQPIKNFFAPIIDFFRTAFEIIGQLAEGCWAMIKAAWSAVSGWFKSHIIDPVTGFFSKLWSGIRNAAATAWNGIKNVWAVVSGWFNEKIISPVRNFFSDMWGKLRNGASEAWQGIKNVFSPVIDWFREKFSKAWQAVKNVFSAGGKVFDGIKDGIASAFKTVVNAIIKGINKVIAIPFNAINKTLDKIRDVSFLGISPFKNLISRFSVPEIPLLAKGGVVRKATGAIIGEDGAEAVVPLEHNTKWIDKLADRLADKIGGGVTVNQTNNYSQAHSRYEIYKSKQATAAAVRLALMR